MTGAASVEGVLSRAASALRRAEASRLAPVITLSAGLVSAAVGAAAGVAGAPLGALIAAVLVVGFFWTGAVPLLLFGDGPRAGFGLVVLLVTYVTRLMVLLILLALVAGTDVADIRWLAVTVIVCTLVWVGTQVALVGRSRATL